MTQLTKQPNRLLEATLRAAPVFFIGACGGSTGMGEAVESESLEPATTPVNVSEQTTPEAESESQDPTTIDNELVPLPVAGQSSHCPEGANDDGPSVLQLLELPYWAINTPVDSDCNDGPELLSDHILPPLSLDYRLSEYITVGDESVVFRAHTGGATTPGSGYPRSELQEWDEETESLAAWDSGRGRHTMTIRQSINHLPGVKAHLVAGQIHGSGDDLHVFRLEGQKLYITDGNTKVQPAFDVHYDLGDVFEAKFVVEDDVTQAFYNGELVFEVERPFEDAHFKVGCYTQSACAGRKDVPGEECDAYGEVEVFSVEVTHEY